MEAVHAIVVTTKDILAFLYIYSLFTFGMMDRTGVMSVLLILCGRQPQQLVVKTTKYGTWFHCSYQNSTSICPARMLVVLAQNIQVLRGDSGISPVPFKDSLQMAITV